MIKSAIEKNADGFESSFNSVMAAKMGAAIETKYEDMFGTSEVADEQEVPEVEAQSDIQDLESESE
jgi:hypothetical protein